jgi:hypothetical protein
VIEAGARTPASPESITAVLVAAVVVAPVSFAVTVAIDAITVIVPVTPVVLHDTAGHTDAQQGKNGAQDGKTT